MNPVDTVPLMLLVLHLLALGVVAVIFLGMVVLHRRARARQQTEQAADNPFSTNLKLAPPRPFIWLAIRSSNPKAVQAALGVSRPAPCPWLEGIIGEHQFFIGPPVHNWIIVTGSSLPQPGQDVDRCFHFMIRLSRVLGHVQFFLADTILHHHAWVRVDNGAVQRAYAWMGRTVWHQGAKSLAEKELNMRCFGYAEEAGTHDGIMAKNAVANVWKVPSLAARWSIDPTAIEGDLQNHADGIAGKSSRFCQD